MTTVLYFAAAKDAAKTDSEKVALTSETDTVTRLLKHLVQRHKGLDRILESSMITVNLEYVDKDAELSLKDGDEVAIIPPVSGG